MSRHPGVDGGWAAIAARVVLVVEDAHWIDSAPEDFLKSADRRSCPGMAVLLDRQPTAPSTRRPFGDPQPTTCGSALSTVMRKHRYRQIVGVRRSAVAELRRRAGRDIGHHDEATPFLLEENRPHPRGDGRGSGPRMPASCLAHSGVERYRARYQCRDVTARADGFGASTEGTVQKASVIGASSRWALPQPVSDLRSSFRANSPSSQANRADLPEGGFRRAEYVFKHALTQDVAYARCSSPSGVVCTRESVGIEEVYAGRYSSSPKPALLVDQLDSLSSVRFCSRLLLEVGHAAEERQRELRP